MPLTTITEVEGFAFCVDPRCPGYEQQPATVRVTSVEWTYIELGGDLGGVERGTAYESFPLADGESPPDCPHCGKRMEASTQKRPDYARVSGQDPLRLLNLEQGSQVRDMQMANLQKDAELAEMRAMLQEMRADMLAMRSEGGPPADKSSPPARGRPKA